MKLASVYLLALAVSTAMSTAIRYDQGSYNDLAKRRGGGGGAGGHGGGSGSHGSSGSGSHGSGSHGSSGSHASSGRGGGAVHPSSSGHSVYGGGGSHVFAAGAVPIIAAGLLAAYAVDVALLWPGYWTGPRCMVYPFDNDHSWTFHNATLNKNVTMPVACLCSVDQSCTCEATTDPAFMASLIKNGTWADLNQTQITVGNLNSVPTLLLNGTVENGTVDAASGAASVGASAPFMAVTFAVMVSIMMSLL